MSTEALGKEYGKSSWFDDETFWESLDWFLFSQMRADEITSAEADQIVELFQPVTGVVILDLCSGPGRHCLEFARRGFRITGVDRTARYLEQARKRPETKAWTSSLFKQT